MNSSTGSLILLSLFLLLNLNSKAMQTRNIVFFGRTEKDNSRLIQLIEKAFENYRASLTSIAKHANNDLLRFQETHQRHKFPTDNRLGLIIQEYASVVTQLWSINEISLIRLFDHSPLQLTLAISDIPFHRNISSDLSSLNEMKERPTCSPGYQNFEQIIAHLIRDWGESKSSRRKIFLQQILHILDEIPASNDSPRPRILVPGAGLGRIAVELASRGYRVEANEQSAIMTKAFHGVIDVISNGGNLTMYPGIHYDKKNMWRRSDSLKSTNLPSDVAIEISNWLKGVSPDGGHLVWQLGNFTEIYTDQSLYNSFDAIVSVFFIDVPGDVVTTVDIFSKILKPGGLLINLGPLHYHDDHVVHYSYDEVEIILDIYGFSKHRFGVEVISGTYCGDDEMNMKPEYYSVPFAVYEKR